MADNVQKKVDEDWKNQVEREKNIASAEPPKRGQAPGADPTSGQASKKASVRTGGEATPESMEFATFLTSLAMQAYGSLGEETELGPGRINLAQAKYLIDILGLLEQKTKGNLTGEEAQMLETLLYELRMKYVEKKGL